MKWVIPLQIILLVLWYVVPTLPAWLVFLPLIISGVVFVFLCLAAVGAAIK